MKRRRDQITAVLAAAALVLTAGAAADRAMAYFTTYAVASGGQELKLGFTTTIPDETVSDWKKNITIKNTGAEPCYVRVKVFAGSEYPLSQGSGTNSNWSKSETDGYYYWADVLKPGDTTGRLVVAIDHAKAEDDFNVIVVQECMPVRYDENGSRLGWDQVKWDQAADVVKTETVSGGTEE